MEFTGGPPFNQNQDLGIQDMWSPATPMKSSIPTRRALINRPGYSHRNQVSEPSWLDLVTGVQTTTPPWAIPFQNEYCGSPAFSGHLQDLNRAPAVAEPSGSHAAIGYTSISNRHNAGLMNCWAPKLGGNVLPAGNSSMPPLPPFFVQNGNFQMMPDPSNQQLFNNGNAGHSQGYCNNSSNSSSWAAQKALYGSPVTFLPNLNSFPETTMSFPGTVPMSNLLNPMTAENYIRRRMQDKHQSLEDVRQENILLEGLRAEASFSNMIASSEYGFLQNPNCVKDLTFQSDETAYQEIGIEKSLAERETEDLELNDGSKQKQRRKKHRPRVIIEGKSARTPKPGTPKPKTPAPAQNKENPTGKRKYTRRNKDSTSLSKTSEFGRAVEPDSRSVVKPVRRSLNFDLEDTQSADKFSVMMSMFMKNLENYEQGACRDGNSTSSTLNEAVDSTVVEGPIVENTLEGVVFDLKSSMIDPQNEYIKILQSPLWSTTVNHDVGASKNIINSNCGVSNAPPRGTKRDLTNETSEFEKKGLMCSYYAKDCASKSHDSCLPHNDKKMRMENVPNELRSAHNLSPKLVYTPANGWRTTQESNHFALTDTMKLIAQEKLQTLERMLLCEETDLNPQDYHALSNNNMSSLTGFIEHKPSWQRINEISQPPTPDKPSGYSNSQESKNCGTLLRFEASEDVNKPVKIKGKRGRKKKEAYPLVNPLPSASNAGASIGHGESLHRAVISFDCQDQRNCKAATNSSFPSSSPCMDYVDYIAQKLRRLSLNNNREVASWQAQNAIVPYIGNGGMMVPYEGPFDLAKRRRPRAKVDLDPETNRVWKLLMGIEVEGDQGTKVDKEKWWEEERRVFRGRADSFIARMHLVQGDRRFSKWKGSVVDSVIGVFLTQNVSDHLSSSAYMSLAAKFPLRSGGDSRVSNTEKDKMNGKNHNDCIGTLADPPDLQRTDHAFYSQASLEINAPKDVGKKENSSANEALRSGSGSSSVVCCTGNTESHETEVNFGHDSPNSGSNTGVTVASISSVEIEDRKLAEEVVSSHNSVVSSQSSTGYQVLSGDHVRSDLMLNIADDDLLPGRMNNVFGCSSFTELLHIAESNKFQVLHSHGSISSANSQVIHNNESGLSILDQLDNLKGPCQPYQVDFTPHQTPSGLSNMLPESQFYCSLGPFNSTILDNNLGTSREETRSSLHGNKFEVNHGESGDSATENLVASGGLNKSLSSSGSASVADSYLPLKLQSMERPNFSETEVSIDRRPFVHKNLAERTDASSNIQNSHGCYSCIQPEAMERLQQKKEHSTFKAEILQDAINGRCQTANCETPKTSPDLNGKAKNKLDLDQKVGSNVKDEANNFHKVSLETPKQVEKASKKRAESEKKAFDWDSLRREVHRTKPAGERNSGAMDSLDWEAVRRADVSEISETIRERGMNNMLAARIKDFLNRLVREHGSIDLEWLRDVPPDKSKDYLLSIRGLGLKSAECVRLLTLHHLAFPVDTNVGRICVRLGWVPLQPLPESLQLHLLELYPVLETIQKYLWPRLCKLDQRTLYELHYQMITFGKVFCTKSRPNCNACPMRGECRHFASAFASARLALPPPEDKSMVSSTYPVAAGLGMPPPLPSRSIPKLECSSASSHELTIQKNCEPIIEEPATPEPESQETLESAIEDAFFQDPDEIPTIKLNFEKFTQNLQNYMQENMELQDGDMSKALVALNPEAASIPTPKLKNISRLRTEHQVYEIPDSHILLDGLDQREPDDPCPYLLAIWTPGETAQSIEPPQDCCNSKDTGQLCDKSTCFACNSLRESQSHTVRGTLLIPCRTAMRGSFPLNGTYFQVNEVFADHHSSRNPIDIPRDWIWNLPRRTVCFGTSIPTIFRGLTTEGIQQCFWRGFVCVRGFDRLTRAPKPLYARLHFPASKVPKIRKGGPAAATPLLQENMNRTTTPRT
ncbi:Transcriptional activator DEMETER [Platanthera zijinensis]|uniref:Transcriptional activator DEMETER n=1 Tax=Platanthera zijinensis TaxID=2320716 RepID=A0AAP0BWF4_9ASPA